VIGIIKYQYMLVEVTDSKISTLGHYYHENGSIEGKRFGLIIEFKRKENS